MVRLSRKSTNISYNSLPIFNLIVIVDRVVSMLFVNISLAANINEVSPHTFDIQVISTLIA